MAQQEKWGHPAQQHWSTVQPIIALTVHDKHYPGVLRPVHLLLLISLPACNEVPWIYCRTGAKLMHCTWERLDLAPSFTQLHCCGGAKVAANELLCIPHDAATRLPNLLRLTCTASSEGLMLAADPLWGTATSSSCKLGRAQQESTLRPLTARMPTLPSVRANARCSSISSPSLQASLVRKTRSYLCTKPREIWAKPFFFLYRLLGTMAPSLCVAEFEPREEARMAGNDAMTWSKLGRQRGSGSC